MNVGVRVPQHLDSLSTDEVEQIQKSKTILHFDYK